MAESIRRRVRRIDDSTIVEVLNKIAATFPDNEPTCKIFYAGALSFDWKEVIDSVDLVGRYAFDRVRFSMNTVDGASVSIDFFRAVSVPNSSGQGVTLRPSATFDEFQISFAPDSAAWSTRLADINSILGIVGESALPVSEEATGEDEDKNTLRSLILGLGATHRQMLATLNERLIALEEKRVDLDSQFQEKQEQRARAHAAALEEIGKERQQLELQSHMAERRRLLRDMIERSASEKMKTVAPPQAIWTRWAVFGSAIILGLLAGSVSVSSFQALAATPADDGSWVLLARAVISSLLAAGALIYATQWLRNFYNADMETAREIERFNNDISRASWVIETVLEVQHENKGSVPDAWIENVTRGLFDSSSRSTQVDEGAQALGALLGYTASAKFGPGGPEFEFGRRGGRRLAEAAKPDGT